MPKSELFDKEVVLEKITEHLWENGFCDTNVRDLANSAGVSTSSLYNTFGSKEDIFFMALISYQKSQSAQNSKLLIKSSTPLEAIRNLLLSYVKKGQFDRKGCLLVNTTVELSNKNKDVKKFLISNKEQVVEWLENLIKEAQTIGEIPKAKDAYQLANYLFVAIQGLRVINKLDSESLNTPSLIDTILSPLQ